MSEAAVRRLENWEGRESEGVSKGGRVDSSKIPTQHSLFSPIRSTGKIRD